MVINDMGGIEPDILQQLAYATTFMYYNWAGTLQVPAMVQVSFVLITINNGFKLFVIL